MELNTLLGGLAEGTKNFTDQYDKARNRQIQEKYAQGYQQQTQAGLLQKGMQTNDQGGVEYNPQAQAQVNLEYSKSDPTSPLSQRQNQFTQGLLGKVDPKYAGLIQPEMSAKEVENNPYIGDVIKGELGAKGRLITAQRIGEGLDIKRDAQASQAADTIHKDRRVQTLNQQIDQLERGRRILDQPTITNQEFNDYQQEIQAAISGAQGGALGKLERTEYTSAKGDWAALKQKITGKPEDAVPPEIVSRLKDLADHTRDMMEKHRANRANELQRNFKHNPEANAEQQKAIQSYQVQPREQGQGMLKPKGNTSPMEDQQAMDWAKANPNNPMAKQIMQHLQGK